MADEEQHTGVGVFLIPAASDPIVAASSEPAHLTTVWLGDMNDLDEDTIGAIRDEIRAYADTLDGPVVVPVTERGTLGDEDADVVFLDPTEALLALREGLLEASPTVKRVMDSVEQFPEWTPHVTLGYPETPAAGDYAGETVTFDSVGLWVGPDQEEYPMSGKDAPSLAAGGFVKAGAAPLVGDSSYVVPLSTLERIGMTPERLETLRAAAAAAPVGDEVVVEDGEDDEMPLDELEDGEEYITEIPVHGVAVVEGKSTGDGRGFRLNALDLGAMPQPLGYEYTSTHGGNTSNVAIVGRIDWYERKELGDGTAELRWRGVVMPGKPYGAQAIESIVDGSYTGLSVIVDSINVDVEEQREEMRQRLTSSSEVLDNGEVPSDEEIEAMIDEFIGDGTQPVTWFSSARVRRFDMVPTGAFQEAYIALGHEFADELTEEQLTAAAQALEDCGCAASIEITDASELTEGKFVVEFSGEEGSGFYGPFDTIEEAEEWIGTAGDGEYGVERVTPALIASAAFAPGTKDGPGWITHPIPTSRIRRYWVKGKGAAKIAWGTPGDFNRCRAQLAKYVQNPDWLAGLCANMHKEAIGVWPGQEGGGRHSLREAEYQRLLASGLSQSEASGTAWPNPAPLVVMASATVEHQVYPAWAFQEPEGDAPFALRIDRETRTISGYAASWNSCHIGISGVCQKAPTSRTDYSFFRKGVVDTDAGEQRVGLITYGIGHADEYASAAAATAHYDKTEAVRAYINIGENRKGIWFAGVLAPWVTDADIDAMRAIGRTSGDWRNWSGMRGDLEMVGLVVVNTEGFQLAASGGVQTSVVGIGALEAEQPMEMVASGGWSAPSETALDAVEFDMDELAEKVAGKILFAQERAAVAARVAPAREALRAHQLRAARAELAKITEG